MNTPGWIAAEGLTARGIVAAMEYIRGIIIVKGLTAHGNIPPEKDVIATLVVARADIPQAVPLAWALYRDMNVEVNDEFTIEWEVRVSIKNSSGFLLKIIYQSAVAPKK